METEVGKVPVGTEVLMSSGKRVRIEHHGESGTLIRPAARVAKLIVQKDPFTGKEKKVRFSSQADAYVVADAAPCQTLEE